MATGAQAFPHELYGFSALTDLDLGNNRCAFFYLLAIPWIRFKELKVFLDDANTQNISSGEDVGHPEEP